MKLKISVAVVKCSCLITRPVKCIYFYCLLSILTVLCAVSAVELYTTDCKTNKK